MEKITGYIDHIIFRNEDNGYTVFQLNNEEGELTCVGKFSYIGERVFGTGRRIHHASVLWDAASGDKSQDQGAGGQGIH